MLIDSLLREERALSVAEAPGPYTLSRIPASVESDESYGALKRQTHLVAQIEDLIRELAESVRLRLAGQDVGRSVTPGGSRLQVVASRLGRATRHLEELEGIYQRLVRTLPEGQAQKTARRLEGLVPELEALLRPENTAQEVISFAFGGQTLSWVCGGGKQAQAMVAAVEKMAATDLPVLISGETGTGKELLARFIHSRSLRAEAAFVAVNCAAIPTELLESQLFGQRAGAFTSAKESTGLLDAAEGGTFFMDEVSELSLDHQAKLLRFIEAKEYTPVGGRRPRRANVRLLCATNCSLTERINRGAFRLDLYHRINDFAVALPPLRERPQDLALLIDFFLGRCSKELGREVRLAAEARDRLLAYHFSGNIRELEKVIRRAGILSEGGLIGAGDLYLEGGAAAEAEGEVGPGVDAVREALQAMRLVGRGYVVPRVLDFLRASGRRWFSSGDYARAAGLSEGQARAQLKGLSAEGGPLEHNGEEKALSRYRLRSV